MAISYLHEASANFLYKPLKVGGGCPTYKSVPPKTKERFAFMLDRIEVVRSAVAPEAQITVLEILGVLQIQIYRRLDAVGHLI